MVVLGGTPDECIVGMRRVGYEEYLEFAGRNSEIVVEDTRIRLKPLRVARLKPLPEELTDVSTTVWSFPRRGSWATHRGDYRGNWPPQIPRALILMYTRPGDLVLDQMIGSGTTCIEARLLGRNCIGVDINYNAVILTLHRLYWLEKHLEKLRGKAGSRKTLSTADTMGDTSLDDVLRAKAEIYQGDARCLSQLSDNSVDLIATHPPYFNIIKYGGEAVEGDLSRARSLEEYLEWMRRIAEESYRVLKPGKHCAILVGDTRIHKHYVPITHHILDIFLKTGFILKEEVVKIQHKMKTTREKWIKHREKDFLLIYHEKLYILRKPEINEKPGKHKYSRSLYF